jgi:hypothetical protein
LTSMAIGAIFVTHNEHTLKMKTFKQVLLIWLGLLATVAACWLLLPHRDMLSMATVSVYAARLLIGIVGLFIYYSEPSETRKPLFFFASLYFLAAFLGFLVPFIGRDGVLFSAYKYADHFAFQYFYALSFFLLAFAVVYVVLDSLFGNFKSYQKFAFTVLIVGGMFALYYSPLFTNPLYLYHTQDIEDWRAVDNADKALTEKGIESPTAAEIAANSELYVWQDGKRIGTLLESEKTRRVEELLPYLAGYNYTVLIYKPLYMNTIYMNVLCVVFIFLFFGYQYKNDPPQGAYIEKIVFLFLPYCSLEILHHYAYIKSVQFSMLSDVAAIGNYLSLANLLALLVFFALRLRFVKSVKGEFYERELVSDSEHISRWRDAFDNLIVRHFLNPQTLHGRLFAPRTAGTETDITTKNHS